MTDVMDISRIPRKTAVFKVSNRAFLDSCPGLFYLATIVAVVAVIAEPLMCIEATFVVSVCSPD